MRLQFTEWTGMPADASADPYSSLPPVEIAGALQDVHEGTGAMRAYQEMRCNNHLVNREFLAARTPMITGGRK